MVDLVRFTGKGISRSDLAEELGLTRAGITIIINDLIEYGLIQETSSRATPSGRPPVVLELNPRRGMVAAIDIGASHINVALGDFSAHVIDEVEYPLNITNGPEHCLKEADYALQTLARKNGIKIQDLSVVGVSVPGPVITNAGMVMEPPIMPGWDRYPIRDALQSLWNIAVTLNNDADLGALGEWAYGAGRDESNLIYIKVGSGIGAGIIAGHQILLGATGSAGEIGHLTIDKNGPLCTCGSRGCLEAYASGRAIKAQAQNLARSGKKTLLAGTDIEKIDVRELAEAARKGDIESQEILEQAGSVIGIAIAGMINMLNPGVVVIGGGVAEVGDLLTTPIRKIVKERSLPASEHTVKITTAMLGRRSTLIGALIQAISFAVHSIVDGKTPLSRSVFSTSIQLPERIPVRR